MPFCCAAIFSLNQVWDHPPVSSSLKLKPAHLISAHIYIYRERESSAMLHYAIMSMVYKKYYHHLGIAPQHPPSASPQPIRDDDDDPLRHICNLYTYQFKSSYYTNNIKKITCVYIYMCVCTYIEGERERERERETERERERERYIYIYQIYLYIYILMKNDDLP